VRIRGRDDLDACVPESVVFVVRIGLVALTMEFCCQVRGHTCRDKCVPVGMPYRTRATEAFDEPRNPQRTEPVDAD
jgi:hypothetical protein